MSLPTLWHFPVSHYNEKVRWALDYKRVPHRRETRFLDYMPRAFLATRQLRLPIVFFEGEAVADSTKIIAELEQRNPEPRLYPTDADELKKALALEDALDEGVGPAVRTFIVGEAWERDSRGTIDLLATGIPDASTRLAKAIAPVMRANYLWRHRINAKTRAVAKDQILSALDQVEQSLGPSGHLVADSFTVADLTAAALLSPLVRPVESQYPIDEALVPEAVLEFADAIASRAAIRWVSDIYRRYRGTSAEVHSFARAGG